MDATAQKQHWADVENQYGQSMIIVSGVVDDVGISIGSFMQMQSLERFC